MISAALIVKNEKDCLDKCLQSINGIGEIIICDTGSEDNTIEIAKKYTDKVFTNYKWDDNFAEARNYSISKCTGDWILVIDADDTLEEGGVDKIKKLAGEAKPEQSVFNFYIHSDVQHFWQPRLFRNNGKILYKGAIHNYLNTGADTNADIKINFGYSPAHKKDPDRALRILTREITNNPDLIREKFYLAREHWYRKDYIAAVWWYKDYLKTAHWEPEIAEAYLQLAKCHWQLRQGTQARDYCLQAIKTNPDFGEALRFMGEMSFPKKRAKWLQFAELATNDDVLFIRHGN